MNHCLTAGLLVSLSFIFFSCLPCSFSLSPHPLPSDSPMPKMTEDNDVNSDPSDSGSTSGTTDGTHSEDESRSEFILGHQTTDLNEEHRTTDTPRRDLIPSVPKGFEDGESFAGLWISDTPNHDPEPCLEQTRLEMRETTEMLRNSVTTYFCCD
jgi:hypothetical protein